MSINGIYMDEKGLYMKEQAAVWERVIRNVHSLLNRIFRPYEQNMVYALTVPMVLERNALDGVRQSSLDRLKVILMSYEYFYGREADKFMFYRIPKLLFELDGLKDMPVESKIMYGMLLDRVSLSAENGWIDQFGRFYIIYTVSEAATALGCSEKKAIAILRELEAKGLIEKQRRGMGKPNLIYVKNFLTELSELQLKNCKNYSLRAVKSTVQELSKLQPNNTNKNNTEMNNTDYEPIREDKQAAEIEERAIYGFILNSIEVHWTIFSATILIMLISVLFLISLSKAHDI